MLSMRITCYPAGDGRFGKLTGGDHGSVAVAHIIAHQRSIARGEFHLSPRRFEHGGLSAPHTSLQLYSITHVIAPTVIAALAPPMRPVRPLGRATSDAGVVIA